MTTSTKTSLAISSEFISPWILCFFLAYISSFFLSGRSLPLSNLDQSYQAVLEYAVRNNFQFGKDILFTFGPLGFLNTDVSQGLFTLHRIIFALLWSGIVAWSVTSLARQILGGMKFVFLVWFLIYSRIGGLEQDAFLIMLYACTILMGDVKKSKGAATFFLILFALLGLVKFTLFMAVTVTVIFCSLKQFVKREFKSSLVIASSFVIIFITFWLLLFQRLENLPPWLKGSLEITSGYTDAMTIFPKTNVLVLCFAGGMIFIASLLLTARTVKLSYSRVGILLVTVVYALLSWKHGFVRADAHTLGFIFFLPLLYSVLLNESFHESMQRKSRLCLSAFFIGVVLLCNWAADLQEPGIMLTKLVDWPRNMIGNSRLILNSVTGKWDNCFDALRANHQLKPFPDLPVARGLIGNASVDVINYQQWAAIANNLNYTPRPVIQGYSAYTPYLQERNLSFYRSEKRPQFLLFNMETIDNRFPTLDDATLLPFILGNFKPVAKDGDFIVLRASPNITEYAKQTLINEQTVTFGESLNLPVCSNELLIMQVEVKPTLIGRAIKFLFQAPVLTLNTKANGKTVSYRFIPTMAERGFVVSPLLLTNNDIMHFYADGNVNCADSISFYKPEYSLGQLSNTITVKLYKLKNSDRGI